MWSTCIERVRMWSCRNLCKGTDQSINSELVSKEWNICHLKNLGVVTYLANQMNIVYQKPTPTGRKWETTDTKLESKRGNRWPTFQPIRCDLYFTQSETSSGFSQYRYQISQTYVSLPWTARNLQLCITKTVQYLELSRLFIVLVLGWSNIYILLN